MPTRLGNILKASEIYAQIRYSIEAVNVWPRLFSVLPRQFVIDMEEKNNHFMFLLNSSFLIFIASLSSLGFALYSVGQNTPRIINNLLYHSYKWWVHSEWSPVSYTLQQELSLSVLESQTSQADLAIGYFFYTIILGGFGYVLYRIAVNAARDFAFFYRAGFDLYRFDLLAKLHKEKPESLVSEQYLWGEISDFLAFGEELEWNKEAYEPSLYVHEQKP